MQPVCAAPNLIIIKYSFRIILVGIKSFEKHPGPSRHARQKRRCVNDPCLFQLYLLWISNCIYAACLSIEMEVKRSNQSKAPSINNKHCFLFPLSFFVTAAVFTRVPFFDRKAKGVKELDRFCLLWLISS